jgi:hypothetical protein
MNANEAIGWAWIAGLLTYAMTIAVVAFVFIVGLIIAA